MLSGNTFFSILHDRVRGRPAPLPYPPSSPRPRFLPMTLLPSQFVPFLKSLFQAVFQGFPNRNFKELSPGYAARHLYPRPRPLPPHPLRPLALPPHLFRPLPPRTVFLRLLLCLQLPVMSLKGANQVW